MSLFLYSSSGIILPFYLYASLSFLSQFLFTIPDFPYLSYYHLFTIPLLLPLSSSLSYIISIIVVSLSLSFTIQYLGLPSSSIALLHSPQSPPSSFPLHHPFPSLSPLALLSPAFHYLLLFFWIIITIISLHHPSPYCLPLLYYLQPFINYLSSFFRIIIIIIIITSPHHPFPHCLPSPLLSPAFHQYIPFVILLHQPPWHPHHLYPSLSASLPSPSITLRRHPSSAVPSPHHCCSPSSSFLSPITALHLSPSPSFPTITHFTVFYHHYICHLSPPLLLCLTITRTVHHLPHSCSPITTLHRDTSLYHHPFSPPLSSPPSHHHHCHPLTIPLLIITILFT